MALAGCNTPGGAGGVRPAAVTVQQGDTLLGIAQRYDVSMTALIQQNGIQEPYTIQPGQVLTLPSGGVMVPAAPASSIVASVPPGGVTATTVPPYPSTTGSTLPVPPTLPAASGPPVSIVPGAIGTGVVPPLPPALGTATAATSTDGSVTVAPLPPIGGTTAPTTAAGTTATTVASATPPAPPATSSSGLSWPVTGSTLVAYNAQLNGKANQGINIAAAAGTPVHAAAAGTVAYAGNELRGYGNLILIRHANNIVTAYAHLASITVSKDQTVQPGQTIGTVGDTGGVSEPQLHFEVREGSTPVDPAKYLP